MQAKEIMTQNVVTVHPSTTIKEAMTLLAEKRISGLVVTGEDDKIIGVITEKDLLVAYDFLRDTSDKIETFINKNVVSITAETSMDEISRLLVEKNIKRVPVLKDGEVLGVVSRGGMS